MKSIKFLFLLVAIVSLSVVTYAQKTFSGTITYEISYEGEGIDDATKAQLPSEFIINVSGNKVRSEQSSAFYSFATIMDHGNGSMIILFDGMGMKYAAKQTKEEAEKDETQDSGLKINYIDETKTIAGYKCKKAEVTVGEGEEEETYEVFYTDEIAVPEKFNDNTFKGLKGVLMEYAINQGEMTMTMKVKEIKKGKPKAALFTIPDDYEVVSMEEFGSMLGG